MIERVTCNRCGYSWIPNGDKLPKHCANKKCKSPYWNKERIFVKRTDGKKKCFKCGEIKPLSDFGISNRASNGHTSQCLECERELRKKTPRYKRLHKPIAYAKGSGPYLGIYIAERVFGTYIVNSHGRKVQVRDIAENHILEDMGTIPTVQDYLQHLPLLPWLGGKKRKVIVDSFDLVD